MKLWLKMAEDKSESTEVGDVRDRIFEAISNKDLEKVKQIVHANPKINLNFVDKDGLSPLQHACHIGNVEFTRLLLDNGADIDYTERRDRYTPLMFAVISSKEDVVRLLLERGADTAVENCVNRTACQMASFVGLNMIAGILMQWLPYETTVEPYTKCRELEDKPRLPSETLGRTLHKYIVFYNKDFIALTLFIRNNLDLIKYAPECLYVLENLLSREAKQCREELAFRYHYSAYLIDFIMKGYNKDSANKGHSEDTGFNSKSCEKYIDATVRRLIKPKRNDSANHNEVEVNSPEVMKLMQDCFLKFPYRHLPFYKNIVLTTSQAGYFGWTMAYHMITGMRSHLLPESCYVCHSLSKCKKCSKCKSALYCGPLCQKIHWFYHKKECPE